MLFNKAWLYSFGCTVAIAAGTSLIPAKAKAASFTVDWEKIAQEEQWENGQRSGSFALGEGNVDINFFLGNDIKFSRWGGGTTPAINDVINGSQGSEDRTLHLQIDAEQVGLGQGDNAMTMVTEFNGYSNPLTDVSFWLYDIDTSGNSWQDRVILKGYLGDEVVAPIFNFLNSNQNSVEVVNPYTLDGIIAVNNNADNSNVLVSFGGAIDRFELIFTDGDDIGNRNPNSHGISIGDISFTEAVATPEPTSLIAMGLVGLGMGAIRLKKGNKKSK